MKKLMLRLSPLFILLLLFSCAKDNEFTSDENRTEQIQAKHNDGKLCDIPCRKPDYFQVSDIEGCSAVLNFGFETKTCGSFIVQLQNLATGTFTYYDPAVSPFTLTNLDPCTKYTVGVSHVTDKCASIPLRVSFKTACKKCKECNIKCKDPDYAYVNAITSTSATVNFGFETKTCGYFVAQLKNNATGTYTFIDPAVSPLVLTDLDPCTSYTIGISHVTDICAKIPTTLAFTTDCPGYCESEGLDQSCLHAQYITLTFDQHPGIWIGDAPNPTLNYIDATDQVLTVPAGTTETESAAGNCFCGGIGDIYIRLWVDFDQSYTFESSEMLYDYSANFGGSPSAIGCIDLFMPGFSIPSVEACGLRARYIISQDPDADPCGTFATGQVVDFTMNTTSCL